MAVRQRLDTGSGGSDFTWPAVAVCAVLFGFVIALEFSSAATLANAADQLHRQFAWRGWSAESPARPALVVTANRRDQLTVVATLSPRGFAPLLAGNRREVQSQIRAHPGALKLAVVDATLPDYASIAQALKDILPVESIIVLKGSDRWEEIAPTLLDRLGVFDNLNPRGTAGSERGSPRPPGFHAHSGPPSLSASSRR